MDDKEKENLSHNRQRKTTDSDQPKVEKHLKTKIRLLKIKILMFLK